MRKSDLTEPDDIVCVSKGTHKGRIGYYDDEENPQNAIIYFGDMFLGCGYYTIKKSILRMANFEDLWKRRNEIYNEVGMLATYQNKDSGKFHKNKSYLMVELNLIEKTIYERDFSWRYGKLTKGKRVFIAHSSKDKHFARRLVSDLKLRGYEPWFDEINLKVGDSIPEGIQKGIKNCHYLIVILSKNANASKWVRIEWMAKFWDEIQRKRIYVLPALLEPCAIPQLLKAKRYANFKDDYNEGLEEIVRSIK